MEITKLILLDIYLADELIMNRKENYEITELRLGFQMNIQLQQQTIKKQPFSMMVN